MLYNTILTTWWWAHSARNMYRHIINLLKTRICALSWSVAKIILRCTVSKTSKFIAVCLQHRYHHLLSFLSVNLSLSSCYSCGDKNTYVTDASLRVVLPRLWSTVSRSFRASECLLLHCQAISPVLIDTGTEEVWIKAEEIEIHALRSVETSETTYPTT